MANAWFRFYHEFATDPKIQMLSESDQRRYVMLLCLRCSNDHVTLQDEEVAFQLRISNEEWEITKRVLTEKRLIDNDNQPVNWDKRQFKSDTSNERVKAWREKKKQGEEARKAAEEGTNKKRCNVTVTPPDTDTDTDTELKDLSLSGDNDNGKNDSGLKPKKTKTKNGNNYSDEFNAFWAFARKQYGRLDDPVGNKSEAWDAFKDLDPDNELCKTMCVSLGSQVEAKIKIRSAGREPSQLKHLCRWVRKSCYEDDPDPVPKPLERPAAPQQHQSKNPKQEFNPEMH